MQEPNMPLSADKKSNEQFNSIVNKWLKDRQTLIKEYCDVEGVNPFSSVTKQPVSQRLEHFCQRLMDYLSAGHFEVYDHLLDEAKQYSAQGLDVITKVYPKIQDTTEKALDFNEKFDNANKLQTNLLKLPRELSLLGEILEDRFQMEDTLLDSFHFNQSLSRHTQVTPA